MRSLVCLLLLVSTCAVCLAADAFSRLNSALKNEDSIRFYSNCFLDKGPCSGDARAIKWLLPDFVATSCGRCSTKQKRAACRVISILQQKKHAETWNALLKKFDPNSIYRKNLDSFNSNCEEKFKIVVSDEEDETANTSDSSAAVSSEKELS